MFEIKDLSVSADEKEIIKGISLVMESGEVHAIMGPNGAGKSSLASALMGHPSFKVKGKIILNESDVSKLPADERAKKGMFLAFQNPEAIEGVKLTNLVRKVMGSGGKEADLDKMLAMHEELVSQSKKLGMDESFVNRELNVDFSGGEKKRLEVLQMVALKPRIIILDEVDSGLDVDGIKLISKAINDMNDGSRTFLIITHYPRILKFVKPDHVHVLVDGRIVRSGGSNLAHDIEERGYSDYAKGKND